MKKVKTAPIKTVPHCGDYLSFHSIRCLAGSINFQLAPPADLYGMFSPICKAIPAPSYHYYIIRPVPFSTCMGRKAL